MAVVKLVESCLFGTTSFGPLPPLIGPVLTLATTVCEDSEDKPKLDDYPLVFFSPPSLKIKN